jgi:hypothetical protein
MPTLEEGDFCLWESNAILVWLKRSRKAGSILKIFGDRILKLPAFVQAIPAMAAGKS